MFCKNCGKSLDTSEEKCEACGFKSGFGTKYCAVCGEGLDEGDFSCKKCGNTVNSASSAKATQTEKRPDEMLKSHEKEILRINIIKLCVAALSFVLIFCVMFVPYFKANYVPQGAEEIETQEQLTSFVENGYYIKYFSMYDELRILIDTIIPGDGEKFDIRIFAGAPFWTWPCSILIVSLQLIYIIGKQLWLQAGLVINKNDATLLKYGEISKAGKEADKTNHSKAYSINHLAAYIVADVLFTKLLMVVFDKLPFEWPILFHRYMFDFSGISGWSAVIITLFVIIAVGDFLVKRFGKRLNIEILREDFQGE
ncbi:MAG: hypothetical protein IJF38_01555 [Clostridia bacterium]|nr:hypothetical protein [Clostridia bacterium]